MLNSRAFERDAEKISRCTGRMMKRGDIDMAVVVFRDPVDGDERVHVSLDQIIASYESFAVSQALVTAIAGYSEDKPKEDQMIVIKMVLALLHDLTEGMPDDEKWDILEEAVESIDVPADVTRPHEADIRRAETDESA